MTTKLIRTLYPQTRNLAGLACPHGETGPCHACCTSPCGPTCGGL